MKFKFEVELNNEANQVEKYKITMKRTAVIDLDAMKEFMLNHSNEVPLTSINFLDIVFRQNRLNTHVIEKRSMFNIKENGEELNKCMVYFQGQYQSIKACEVGWMQNIDRLQILF